MPTLAQVELASVTLTATAQAQLLALIRGSDRYKRNPDFYELPATAIAAASGTVKGQQLNAALTLLDSSGYSDGVVELAGGEEAVLFSQERERESLVSYMISVLYEQPPRSQILTTSAETEQVF